MADHQHSIEQELAHPLRVVHGLLAASPQLEHKDLYDAVSQHFATRVAGAPEVLQQVPVLTSKTADRLAGGLVRFRGMVADMFNPEFFLGAYKTPAGGDAWRPAALYTDAPPPDVDAATATLIMERRPLLLTPVPHEQPWATAAWAGAPPEPSTPAGADRIKRARDAPLPGSAAAAAGSDACSDAAAAGAADTTKQARTSAAQQPQDQELRQPRDQGAAPRRADDDEHAQDTPPYVPGDCIVQVYGEVDALRLHDVVEVLGVLSVVPGLAALQMRGGQGQAQDNAMDVDGGADNAAAAAGEWDEPGAALPPTSQVLRLHALCVRKVPANPLAPASPPAALAPAEQQRAALLRSQALSLLSAAVGGDELAAEYLLLTSLGTVVGRDESGAVGLVPLNLSHCPGGADDSRFVRGVQAALSCMLPHVAHLPLTLAALNSRRWFPEQHAGSGRLFRGCLQAPEGALLLLDETHMSAGQLGEAGVRNLQALHQVLAQQQLPCGCQVYSHNLAVNTPAVILSTAGRSLLRDSLSLLQLPLHTAQQGPAAIKPGFIDTATAGSSGADGGAGASSSVGGPDAVAAAAVALPAELPALRAYLAAARGAAVVLDQSAAEACVARFRALQGEEQGLGFQDLHTLITLSKLLCASMGQHGFTMAAWDRAVQLERMRKARVASMQPAAPAPAPAQAPQQAARQQPQRA